MTLIHFCLFFFFFNDTATTEIYTLSLHDALPIFDPGLARQHVNPVAVFLDLVLVLGDQALPARGGELRYPVEPERIELGRSEEHTSELQSPCNLVCRLLLEKKKTSSVQALEDSPQ